MRPFDEGGAILAILAAYAYAKGDALQNSFFLLSCGSLQVLT
jgi:hypothetical protein